MVTTDASHAGHLLKEGLIGVVPTESVYGLVASAQNAFAIDRVYDVKHRPDIKPCIVLIAQANDMRLFGIDTATIDKASNYWPGKVSVVVPADNALYEHLTRGTGSIAFRVAGTSILQEIVSVSGPIIAPSANPDALAPATTVQQAYDYFGDSIDFYIDGGECNERPSTVVNLDTGHIFRQ